MNAVKHAFKNVQKKEIHVKLERQGDKHILIFYDNGIGLPKNFDIFKSNSLGMKIIKMFTDQLHGNLDIDTESAGTTCKITLTNLNKK